MSLIAVAYQRVSLPTRSLNHDSLKPHVPKILDATGCSLSPRLGHPQVAIRAVVSPLIFDKTQACSRLEQLSVECRILEGISISNIEGSEHDFSRKIPFEGPTEHANTSTSLILRARPLSARCYTSLHPIPPELGNLKSWHAL